MKKLIAGMALLITCTTAAGAESSWYFRADYSVAQFKRVEDSTRAIERKLNSEGVSADINTQDRAFAVAPVLGYQMTRHSAFEISARQYTWQTRARALSGPTNLISSDTGALIPVDLVDFASTAKTEAKLFQIGLALDYPVYRGEILTRLAVIKARVCSDVHEVSDNVLTSTSAPVHVESRAGACRSPVTGSITTGYTHHVRGGELSAFVEVIGEIGNRNVVFVDGGGVGNSRVPVFGVSGRITF